MVTELRPDALPESSAPSGPPRTWEGRLHLIRIILLATLAPATWLGIIPPASGGGMLMFLAVYAVTLAVAPRRVAALRRADVIVILDLLVITLVVFLSGALRSPFLYLYYLVILEASLTLNLFQAVLTAMATAALIVLLGLGASEMALRGFGHRLGVFTAGGFLIALLIGIVAEVYRAGQDRTQWRFMLNRQFRDATTRLQDQVERLNRLAQTDSLTGLANHRAMWEALEREIARAGRFGQPVSLVVMEIDKFKQVNDRHGRLQGDAVLRNIAAALRKACRTMDLAARFGGDEFVLLLPQTPKIAAVQVGERLRRQLEELSFPERIRLTSSVGVACVPDDATTTDALLEAAEWAMYQAKHSGGNRVSPR